MAGLGHAPLEFAGMLPNEEGQILGGDQLKSVAENILKAFEGFDHVPILVVSFSGTYRGGAEGKPDSRFMRMVAEGAWIAADPGGGILDLRELAYSAGDDFGWVTHFSPYPDFPCAVVVSWKNEGALRSLFEVQTLEELENFFEDMESAWQYVEEKMKKNSPD